MKDIYVEIDKLPNAIFHATKLNDVVEIFSKHCIRLHIDTGWPEGPDSKPNSGGGQTVEARKILTQPKGGNYRWTQFWSTAFPQPLYRKYLGRYNDFYDYKVGCFDIRNGLKQPRWTPYFDGGLEGHRENIFHYCLAAEHVVRFNKTGKVIRLDFKHSKGINGMSDIGGDDMILATVTIDQNARSLEKVFMHELGHNLNLVHTESDMLTGDEKIDETVMNSPASSATKLDYLRKEWASIDLTAVKDGRAQKRPLKLYS
jgi:hypothetical protein